MGKRGVDFRVVTGVIKRVIEKYNEWSNCRQREMERDLDFFEADAFYFLKLIFVKGGLNKEKIKRKRRLSKEKFNDLVSFLKNREYICEIIISKPKSDLIYEITDEGIDYLLEFRKSKQEKSSAGWIMWATIVLAVSAAINVIDILLNNERTRNYIASVGVSLLRSFVEFIGGALQLIFWIFIFWIVYYVVKRIFHKFKKKKHIERYVVK